MRLASYVLLGTMAGLAAGQGCNKPDYECGERNLPGTEGCPCLPGDVCAQDLVCAAGVCLSETPSSTGGGEAGTGASSGTETAAGSTAGTATGATAASSSDTGTAGGTAGASTGG